MHLFWGGKMSRLLYWAVANVSKILVINVAPSEREKEKSTGGPLSN